MKAPVFDQIPKGTMARLPSHRDYRFEGISKSTEWASIGSPGLSQRLISGILWQRSHKRLDKLSYPKMSHTSAGRRDCEKTKSQSRGPPDRALLSKLWKGFRSTVALRPARCRHNFRNQTKLIREVVRNMSKCFVIGRRCRRLFSPAGKETLIRQLMFWQCWVA